MKKTLFLCCMIVTTLSLAKKWDATYIAKLIAGGGIDKVIQYYHDRYYGPNRDPQDAFKLAELYVRKKDYATAMQWYMNEKQLINTSKVNLFNYANTCRLMGDYQKALDGYLMYAAQTGDINKVIDLANQCERVLKASAIQDNYKLENYTYNTPADETNLTVLRTNPVYVTIQHPGSNDEKPTYTLHQVVRDFQNFAEPVDVLYGDQQQMAVTSLSYTRDGNTVAFSTKAIPASSKKKSSKEIEKIFMADNLGGHFLNIKPFPFNSDAYSVKDPAFNSDGTILYFSSDQAGGLGGFDIWKSTLEKGKWTNPIPLGKLLNSKNDEVNPFLVQDKMDNILYFSSDREGGFGGFDIYSAKNTDNTWQGVEMQPAPINSSADDISMIYDNEIKTGYFSSDRSGGKGGFDVYRFTPFNLRLIINTMDSVTNKVIDYALVEISANGTKINEAVTNEHGKTFFQIARDKFFSISVSKDNYRPVTTNINSAGKTNGDSVEITLFLKQDAQFSIANGATNNLSMDNYITFTGKVIDASTNKPVRTAKMRMVNYTTKKLREVDIDNDGRFQIKLLLNNSYKVIFENQDNKLTDELTTYGLDKYDVKVRDYILAGSKIKLLDNRVYKGDNVPPELKIDMKHSNTSVPNPSKIPVTPKEIDSLVRLISNEKVAPKTTTLTNTTKHPEQPGVKKEIPQTAAESKPEKIIVSKPEEAPSVASKEIAEPVVKVVPADPVKEKSTENTSPKVEKIIEDKPVVIQNETTPSPEVKKEEISAPAAGISSSKTVPSKVKEKTEAQKNIPQPVNNTVTVSKEANEVHPGLYYKIQLGSYPDGTLTFPEFDQIGIVEVTQSYGQYVYRLGDINTLADAKTTLDKVRAGGYYAAFILQYNKDKVTAIVK